MFKISKNKTMFKLYKIRHYSSSYMNVGIRLENKCENCRNKTSEIIGGLPHILVYIYIYIYI